MFIDLTGQQFERLNVISFNGKDNCGKSQWLCKCRCGNTTITTTARLRNGNTKSCGCIQKEKATEHMQRIRGTSSKDLVGRRFGKLVVIEKTNERYSSSKQIIWKCKCDCGNECCIPVGSLTSKATQSCGCISKEKSAINIKSAGSHNQIFETNIGRIQSKKLSSNNKSGYTGVYYSNYYNKWKAVINFQKKYYQLGYYIDIADAIKVRNVAEKELFGNFLKWYYDNYPKKKTKIG